MAAKETPHVWSDLRGGQNSAQPPHLVGPTQCVSAVNVEFLTASIGSKRRGSRKVQHSGPGLSSLKTYSTMIGAHANNAPNGEGYQVLVEASDFASWYGWGLSYAPEFDAIVSMIDTQASNACVVAFNGDWIFAYDSAVDRLHRAAIGNGIPTVYRTGLAAPSAPTPTKAAGAITDNRKYRAVVYNSLTGIRSEPSAETAVVALVAEQVSLSAPGAAPTGENYDRWELQVASDADNYATWWVIGNAVAANAIGDTSATAVAARGLEPADELGLYTTQPSAKYLGVDDNRLLMAGSYEDQTTISAQQRVWFSPVLGDRNEISDHERLIATASVEHFVDIDAGDEGGPIMGFGPPIFGSALVFKRNQIWKLTRTGQFEAPYVPDALTKAAGTFGYRTICAGEDATGNPALYFAGAKGPYRLTVNGLEWLGQPIRDVWARVNQYGSVHTSQHAVFYPDKGQYYLWVSVDGATTPSVLLVYTVETGGWATFTGAIAAALSSALLPRFIQSAGFGITTEKALTAPRVPYVGTTTAGTILECDAINPSTGAALDTDSETYSGAGTAWDDGEPYAGSVQTPPVPHVLGSYVSVAAAHVFADAQAGASLTLTLTPDYDASQARTAIVSLVPTGSETRVVRGIEVSEIGKAKAVQATIGDAGPVANQWAIHALGVRVHESGTR